MATLDKTEVLDLAAKFPGVVVPDERENYSGWIVEKDSLIEVATFLRDEIGYDFLSSVTGVDYLPEGKMEVQRICHFRLGLGC